MSFLPTAGAVAVRNAKGELVVQKVKVKRYVQGKRPEYAPGESESEVSLYKITFGYFFLEGLVKRIDSLQSLFFASLKRDIILKLLYI